MLYLCKPFYDIVILWFSLELDREPLVAQRVSLARFAIALYLLCLPIGVLLLHKNLAVATQSNLYGIELPDDAIMLSYLPLAHIYEVLSYLW